MQQLELAQQDIFVAVVISCALWRCHPRHSVRTASAAPVRLRGALSRGAMWVGPLPDQQLLRQKLFGGFDVSCFSAKNGSEIRCSRT